METRTDIATDKKAETYLNEKNMISNAEWNIGLKCSGMREWLRLPGKCSVVMVGELVGWVDRRPSPHRLGPGAVVVVGVGPLVLFYAALVVTVPLE